MSADAIWSYVNSKDVWNIPSEDLVKLYNYWKEKWIIESDPQEEKRAEGIKEALETVMARRFVDEHAPISRKTVALEER